MAEVEDSKAGTETLEEPFHMDELAFRAFYDMTARPLWSYLSHMTRSPSLADDLVQESYYRFLRAKLRSTDRTYQKNYLFRIATNLTRDYWRGIPQIRKLQESITATPQAVSDSAERVHHSFDLDRAMTLLKPRERQILWLAYVEGSSHKEIAEVVGLRAASIRLLLFRARRKLAALLRKPSPPLPDCGDNVWGAGS